MMKTSFKFALFLFPLLFLACAPTRFVEPLEKNQWALGASVGGPVIGFGNAVLPTPLGSVEAGYGIDSNITVFGGLQITSAIFSNLHMDLGATFRVLQQERFRPNISITPGFQYVADFNDSEFKFWPNLDANAYWNYGQRNNYFYIGASNYFELTQELPHDQDQKANWLFNPQIGHVFRSKNQKWQYTLELKFIAPYLESKSAFVPYRSLTGDYGATGFYVGIRRTIGGKSCGMGSY